jgi:hypothetical protein
MALIHEYTLVCDEVRQENNGKYLVIGLYAPGIIFQRFPATLNKLTFFTCLRPQESGTWELAFRLSHLDTGAIVGPEGKVKIEIRVQSNATYPRTYVPLVIPGIQFQMPGLYALTLEGANFQGTTVVFPVELRTGRVH